jgi:CRISPR-associated protein (TIGR02584 family)
MKSKKDSIAVDPNKPYLFPRRVLLAVTGLSPQVVTETVYALTQKSPQPFIPTEVHLLTTAEGAEHARLMLLSATPGWFHRLCRDYGLPHIKFNEQTIHALASLKGTPVADIRTREDNERLADALTETIRELTSDANCALHVSIAGGRKTMGFYAGYVLSLFARPQDRLSHVLVSEPYESNHDFFYPTTDECVISARDRSPIDARKADVSLVDIPFVRLRRLAERIFRKDIRFSEVVAAAQRALDPPVLKIDFYGKCIYAGGQQVMLPPAQLAFLSWLARRAKTMPSPDVEYPPDGAPNRQYAEEYLKEYRHLGDDLAGRTGKELRKHGMTNTFFDQTKTRLHTHLERALGPEGMVPYSVHDNGERPRLYRIGVPPANIDWLEELSIRERAGFRKLAKSSSQS